MTRDVELITTPQELEQWIRDAEVQMKFNTDDMEILLGYLEGHGYALAKDEHNQLVRVDMESDEVEVEDYTLDDAIDQACEWNYSLILEADENVVFHIIYNFMLHIIYHRFRNCHSGFSTLFNPNYAY